MNPFYEIKINDIPFNLSAKISIFAQLLKFNMNAFDIELIRQYLLLNLPKAHGRTKVFLFFNYYKALLDSGDSKTIDAFYLEFIEEYLSSLNSYTAYCIAPNKTVELIEQLERILSITSIISFKSLLQKEIDRLESQLNEINLILSGAPQQSDITRLAFPLIEQSTIGVFETYGFLETVRITVAKGKNENKLYVFPKTGILEKNIEKQIYDSFSLAMKYLKPHQKKFFQFHELTVYFDNYSATYIGNSLGVALTIGFIEQLSTLYNLPFLVKIKNNIASTGAIGKDGKIHPVNKNYIEKKVEVIFYSSTEIFIVAKQDEANAKDKLNQLKKIYPNRNLKIIGVSDLDDLLDRRTLINISKQNPFIRTAKISVKNWQITLLVIILYIITAMALIRNFDENPAILESVGKTLYVKNKSGRVLWTKEINYDANLISSDNYLRIMHKLVDINNDGINEVIITNESLKELKNENEYGRIACLNNLGGLVWKYSFFDSVSSSGEILPPFYLTNVVDTFSLREEKYLLAISSSRSSYNSSIFMIDLKNGKRSSNVFWHNGFIRDALVYDFNNDGKKEIAFAAINNSFGKIAFGVLNPEELSGQCPNNNSYGFDNIPVAKLNSYIILPKTDYNKYLNLISPSLEVGCIENHPDERYLQIRSIEGENKSSAISFMIFYEWHRINILTEDKFIAQRDTLIKHKILTPPFTGTMDFVKQLNSEIMFWTGKDFIGKQQFVVR